MQGELFPEVTMRCHFFAISPISVLAILSIFVVGEKRPSPPRWQAIRYGMLVADVESLIGRPPDHPLLSPGYYGFGKLNEIAATVAIWDREDVAVFFDANGRGLCYPWSGVSGVPSARKERY